MSEKNYHFIAIGGAVMHQLALHLHNSGHHVTGSDDVIFDPALTNLKKHGILPSTIGWDAERVHPNLDAIILGMHAQKDNPELLKAQELGIPIYSFPEFIYEQSKNKKRIVVAGSHGKTTTTSMIMFVLKAAGVHFDYLVGAQIEGFDYVVKTSNDAPYMVIEGDEYLTSPLDFRSKFLHYHPHIAVITGIAWDHINVFPTYQNYVETFRKFIHTVSEKIFYFHEDKDLESFHPEKLNAEYIPYEPFHTEYTGSENFVIESKKKYPIHIFGEHNMANLKAAYLVCKELGIHEEDFFRYIQNFKGASKRMELLFDDSERNITFYRDFAHAPSKVTATVKAIRGKYPERKFITCLELHTYSSLQKNFIHQYQHSLEGADAACVFIDAEALKLKKREPIDNEWLIQQFDYPQLKIPKNCQELKEWVLSEIEENSVILMMSSGHWGGLQIDTLYS